MAPEIHVNPCIIRESGFDESNPYDPEHVSRLHVMTNIEMVNMYHIFNPTRVSCMTRDDTRMYRFVGAPFMAPEIHKDLCIIYKSRFDKSNPYDPEHVSRLHVITGTKMVNMYHIFNPTRVSCMTRDDTRMYRFVGAPFMAPANP